MKKSELESSADKIEEILHDGRTPARVTGGELTPFSARYKVQSSAPVERIESLAGEIASALNVPAAMIVKQGSTVLIEIPRSDPNPLKFTTFFNRIPRERIPFCTAALGLAEDGAPLLIRLPSPEVAHILISGTTGAGKTALMQTIIMSLALSNHRRNVRFVLIDPGGRAFEPLSRLPHLLMPTVILPELIEKTLTHLGNLLEQRLSNRVTDPRIIVAIDELADMVQSGGTDISDSLMRLIQRGREAGIHVVGSTQKPSSSIIGPLVKEHFPVRLVGRVVSAIDANIAAGVGGTGAEKLTGTGDFIAVYGPGLIRFRAAYLSAEEIEKYIREI